MKTLLILLVMVTVTITGYAQLRIDRETNTYQYDSVVSVPGASTDVLLSRAKLWLSSKYPQQPVHSEANRVVGVGSTNLEHGALIPTTTLFKFTIQIEVKDERYRYEIRDFTYTYNELDGNFNTTGATTTKSLSPDGNTLRKKISKQLDQHIKSVIKELTTALASDSGNSDW